MQVRKRIQFVEADSGEVLYDEVEQMSFFLFTDRGYLLNNRKPAVRMFQGVDWPVEKADRQRLLDLMDYISKHNGLMRQDRPDHPLTAPLIASIVGLSESRTYSFIKRLSEKGVVKKDQGVIYVNPLYLMAGNRLSPELYRIFKDQLKTQVPVWVQAKYHEAEQTERR